MVVYDRTLGPIKFILPADSNPQTLSEAAYAALRAVTAFFEQWSDEDLGRFLSPRILARKRMERAYLTALVATRAPILVVIGAAKF